MVIEQLSVVGVRWSVVGGSTSSRCRPKVAVTVITLSHHEGEEGAPSDLFFERGLKSALAVLVDC